MGIMLGVPGIFNFVLNHFKLQYAMLNAESCHIFAFATALLSDFHNKDRRGYPNVPSIGITE